MRDGATIELHAGQTLAHARRSQAANRKAALERFAELLAGALAEEPERLPTRAPKAARRRRLEAKRRQSRVKRERRSPPPVED